MQLGQLFAMADEVKPNQYDNYLKTQWLNEVEFKVVDQVLNMYEGNDITFKPYDYDLDSTKELLVPDVFLDVYLAYIYAKIDFAQSEFERYNNSVALHNSAFEEYGAWYKKNHTPKQKASLGPF